MNYYHLPEVSNSNLKELRAAYFVAPPRDLSLVFAFGSLVDAMLTEEEKVDYFRGRLHDDGKTIQFSEADFALAIKLTDALRRDAIARQLLPLMKGQYIFRRTLSFEFNGTEYNIRGRCKFDGFSKTLATATEYKTTACTTYKAFKESIEFFDYDQAAAWYMDLARIDRLWIFGISKKTAEVFRFAVERGDETYTRGLKKYSYWAFQWLTLIEPFHEFLTTPKDEIYKL